MRLILAVFTRRGRRSVAVVLPSDCGVADHVHDRLFDLAVVFVLVFVQRLEQFPKRRRLVAGSDLVVSVLFEQLVLTDRVLFTLEVVTEVAEFDAEFAIVVAHSGPYSHEPQTG